MFKLFIIQLSEIFDYINLDFISFSDGPIIHCNVRCKPLAGVQGDRFLVFESQNSHNIPS